MRLRLDFSIDTVEARKSFLDEYLSKIDFIPNNEELEMMGNYILWGKNPDGSSPSKDGSIHIETRHKTWDTLPDESLDELMAQPNFNEQSLFNTAPKKKVRQHFSRQDARDNAPAPLQKTFEELFRQIDEIDLELNFYDLEHGKRKNPPRAELVEAFTFDEVEKIHDRARHLNQFKYLKKRHDLVELRKSQFTLRDSYAPTIVSMPSTHLSESAQATFDDTIEVFPLGVIGEGIYHKIFLEEPLLNPTSFNEEELEVISKYYWEKHSQYEHQNFLSFDFRNTEHIFGLFSEYYELEEQDFEEYSDEHSLIHSLLETLKYYTHLARLDEMHREILQMKIDKKTNKDIQIYINKKYEKKYTENYISTIFRQKILTSIAEAATYHYEIIGQLWFEENFHKCNRCGTIYLLCPHNFVKKSRSKTGYSGRCKLCEKQDRKEKKLNEKGKTT